MLEEERLMSRVAENLFARYIRMLIIPQKARTGGSINAFIEVNVRHRIFMLNSICCHSFLGWRV